MGECHGCVSSHGTDTKNFAMRSKVSMEYISTSWQEVNAIEVSKVGRGSTCLMGAVM